MDCCLELRKQGSMGYDGRSTHRSTLYGVLLLRRRSSMWKLGSSTSVTALESEVIAKEAQRPGVLGGSR
jgi:hypothetical protein